MPLDQCLVETDAPFLWGSLGKSCWCISRVFLGIIGFHYGSGRDYKLGSLVQGRNIL